tara:strand:- start:52 stop:573 length:522 start_codon:yes stop_codon:yes gene_type:complete
MSNKRASKEQLQERYERAANLLSKGTPCQEVVRDLAKTYEVSPQQSREYVREGKKLVIQAVDPDDKTFMICSLMDSLKQDRLSAREANNFSAAVGADKAMAQVIKLLIQHQREEDPMKMWGEEIEHAFQDYVKEKLKPASGKIPRSKISDLDRFEKYVHPWDKHCQEQDNIPF